VDGPVRRAEIDAFKAAFRIPLEAVRDIGLMFDEARDSQQDPIAFARVMGSTFADQPHRLEDVLNALFAIAAADGPINGLERTLLGHIATRHDERVRWVATKKCRGIADEGKKSNNSHC
jgi:DnaJ like chaperone protein